jgi:hypothetical protein
MPRWLKQALVVVPVLALAAIAGAQNSRPSIAMDGAVIDALGQPVTDATVILVRAGSTAGGGSTVQRASSGRTDSRGSFSLGRVALETEVSFPLETGVRFDYQVMRNGSLADVADLSFVAPREDGRVAAVSARIRLR